LGLEDLVPANAVDAVEDLVPANSADTANAIRIIREFAPFVDRCLQMLGFPNIAVTSLEPYTESQDAYHRYKMSWLLALIEAGENGLLVKIADSINQAQSISSENLDAIRKLVDQLRRTCVDFGAVIDYCLSLCDQVDIDTVILRLDRHILDEYVLDEWDRGMTALDRALINEARMASLWDDPALAQKINRFGVTYFIGLERQDNALTYSAGVAAQARSCSWYPELAASCERIVETLSTRQPTCD
jgi:hypothetical protein